MLNRCEKYIKSDIKNLYKILENFWKSFEKKIEPNFELLFIINSLLK